MIDEQRLEALANAGDDAAWVELLRLRVRRGEDVLKRLRDAVPLSALAAAPSYPDFCWPEHLRGIPADLACVLHRADHSVQTFTRGLVSDEWRAVNVRRNTTSKGGAKAGGWSLLLRVAGVMVPVTEPPDLCVAGSFVVLNQSCRKAEIKFPPLRRGAHLNLISHRCADLYRTHAHTRRSDTPCAI